MLNTVVSRVGGRTKDRTKTRRPRLFTLAPNVWPEAGTKDLEEAKRLEEKPCDETLETKRYTLSSEMWIHVCTEIVHTAYRAHCVYESI